MLSFWKKPLNSKVSSKLSQSPSSRVKNGSISAIKNFEPGRIGPLSGFEFSGSDVIVTDKSRLLLNLQDCLNDKTAQAYFMQFLEFRGLVRILQLYFDVDLVCSRNILHNAVAQADDKAIKEKINAYEIESEVEFEPSKFNKQLEKIDASDCIRNENSLNCDIKNCDSEYSGANSEPYFPKALNNKFEQSNKKVLKSSDCDLSNSIHGHHDKFERWKRTSSSSEFSCSERDSRTSPSKTWQQIFTDESALRLKDIDSYWSKFEAIMSQGEITEQASTELFQLKSVLYQCLQECWTDFISSELYCKYQVEVLTNGSIELGDILNHETTLSYFMEFLEGEGCQSIVEFWLAASHFQRFLRECGFEYDSDQAQADAVVIYDKYLSLQATTPLGFSSEVRCAVELAICRENELPLPNCFDSALNVALAFLKKNCLPSFFSSQHYVRLLSDMIKSSSYKTNSPASSVSEFSTDSKLSISSKADPDFIWRKRQQCGLSLGHIDPLGRFETTIEPEPDKKSESKLTRVVKKLVSKNEDKAQEEMAWRVAEMIVKDVTNVTMGGPVEDEDFS